MTPDTEARPVLISWELAEILGVTDRVRPFSDRAGVVKMTEVELLAFGADRIEWNEPDVNGWYTPTLYSKPPEPLA